LGHALHMLGNLKEAEQDVCAHLLRKDIPPFDRANCLTALAGVLRDQGRLGEALEKAEEAAAVAKTLPEACLPPKTPHQYYLALCHLKEASILERMGRLKEAVAKDQLCPPPLSAGAMVRVALLAVAQGRLEEASTNLRTVVAHVDDGDPMNVEGPDFLLRAKELLCQVLHTLRERSADPGAEAEETARRAELRHEETALRAELRHEEARRGEALREVRALVRQVTGEREGGTREGEEAHLVAVVPKPSRKKKSKKGKRGRKGRAAGTAAQAEKGEENEDGPTTEAAAAVPAPPALEVQDAAAAGEDEGPADAEEEAEDKDDCPVCLQPLAAEGGQEEGVLIMCGHEFHVTCLDTWVSTCVRKRLDVTCPSCRAPVSR
jgi:hypothetical protein